MKAALLLLPLLLLLLLVGFASGAFITGCPMSFEFLNYTIITSKCKAPQYLPSPCCSAFKELACPYINLLNNGTYDCIFNMFSYIYSNGNFPRGLFSSECSDVKGGISCPSELSQNTTNENGGSSDQSLSIALLLVSGFSMALQLS
ncbi:GPI-anchored protein LLG1-like [Typha latifolia]|uniref:GPI-anchored protein LLG1-like n=1 Tax=Typha latifolia TaxID=4733 RepID=UPI003C2AF746